MSNPLKKGDSHTGITQQTMAAEGKCIARYNGQVIFVQGGAPGDVVCISLTKIKSSFLEGRVVSVEAPSPFRSEPFCQHFGLCGGCSWQHIQYREQLKYKLQQVADHLERIGGLSFPPIRPIMGSEKTQYYRNKLDYTFTADRWRTREELNTEQAADNRPGLGYHIPRMYDRVFDVQNCYLQPDPSNAIRLLARQTALDNQIPFFDLRKQVGFLRTLTIRTTTRGETMIILQVTYDEMPWIEKMLTTLTNAFHQITSAFYVINGKRNDTFHDLNMVCWKGNAYITECMPTAAGDSELQFRVGPKSFYQTNSEQAFQLYRAAWQMASLTGDELVYDLYTGTGTIANFVAPHARHVVGLEYVADAIEDARVNSQINNIPNTSFFAGDMKDLLNEPFLREHGQPDVVITDPPRAGMHENVCTMLLKAEPKRIVYVSCNPATQARDLAILSTQYEITGVQPVDMFPHTIHVENIVALARK
ncbi:MAG TPA: 23S rRNA (uracil(1939)-C(5))-methyltransferase RlmD [Cytophagales bacterium]|nr:23S rRNA (uracil(1939)-C(5))-methyltransferase RlmD [Cytophagales bacterium]